MGFARDFLAGAAAVTERLDAEAIERLVQRIAQIRSHGGRLFFLGVGGGAGHASHAVNDFRKLAGMECYAPTDNVSELTARVNDDGWDSAFSAWLEGSRLAAADGVFVFSVGGGDRAKAISTNIVAAVDYAKSVGAAILGIVGRDGGHVARVGDAVVVVPTIEPALVTAYTESVQAVVWHLLVSHPLLARAPGKWESVTTHP